MPFLDHFKQLFAGKRLNVSARFALLREAIQGTMSNFYMARDLRTNKIVGLKILNPKKTAEFNARFRGLRKPSEGEISLLLKHPNIVETYEYGLTTDDELNNVVLRGRGDAGDEGATGGGGRTSLEPFPASISS